MIYMYSIDGCSYCANAKVLIKELNIPYKIITVKSQKQKDKYKELHGMNTFPQIFFKNYDGRMIKLGGYNDLVDIVDFCRSY